MSHEFTNLEGEGVDKYCCGVFVQIGGFDEVLDWSAGGVGVTCHLNREYKHFTTDQCN